MLHGDLSMVQSHGTLMRSIMHALDLKRLPESGMEETRKKLGTAHEEVLVIPGSFGSSGSRIMSVDRERERERERYIYIYIYIYI